MKSGGNAKYSLGSVLGHVLLHQTVNGNEAILQMEMLGHNFFVFLNHETEEVNVVYQRKDGDYLHESGDIPTSEFYLL